jgi:shikimate kinase
MKIFIIGFMGSGKSTFGKKLAKALGLDFYDLDKMVEEKAKCSVSDIFKYLGEDTFRRMESDTLKSFSNKTDFVLSTGGGTPCYFDNMDFILKNGICIYLDMDAKSIFDRLKKAKKVRPSIAGLNEIQLMEFIDETLKRRQDIYIRAHHKISGINIEVKDVLKILR